MIMKTLVALTLLFCAVAAAEDGEFQGMNVLCIACSSGIGKSAAEILLRGGAKVVVSSRTQSKCDDVVKDFKNGFAVAGDASVADDMTNLVDESRKFLGGPISHLVYAPTALALVPFTHPDIEELLRAFTSQVDMNVLGLVRVWKLIEKDLVDTKGAVVAVSSVASFSAVHGFAPYGVAKAAQISAVKALALEGGREGVRVNAVSPACIDTPVFDVFGEGKDALMKELEWRHLLGRVGTPDEVGHTIAFLLSEKAGFITGQNIVIDGGFELMNTLSDAYTPYLIPEEHRKPGHTIFAPGGAHGEAPTQEPEL